jgi:hypothetical protein
MIKDFISSDGINLPKQNFNADILKVWPTYHDLNSHYELLWRAIGESLNHELIKRIKTRHAELMEIYEKSTMS